ncbi:hypothetical protein Tco_0529578 [Tanacetum coccineum]
MLSINPSREIQRNRNLGVSKFSRLLSSDDRLTGPPPIPPPREQCSVIEVRARTGFIEVRATSCLAREATTGAIMGSKNGVVIGSDYRRLDGVQVAELEQKQKLGFSSCLKSNARTNILISATTGE